MRIAADLFRDQFQTSTNKSPMAESPTAAHADNAARAAYLSGESPLL